jgi:hypothetical protein
MLPLAHAATVFGGLAVVLSALAGSPAVPQEAAGTVTPLKTLRNRFLEVTIHSDSSTVIHDLTHDRTWEAGPVALQEKGEVEIGQVWLDDTRSLTVQYPGRFVGQLEGDAIRFTLLGRQNRIIGTFLCHVSLADEWLVYRIEEIDESIPSLVFPPPIQSDAIVIPKGVGEIIRDAQGRGMYPRYIYPFFTRLNMRWLGGLKDDAGWIGIFDEGFEDACGFVANRTASPIMTRSLGRWRHGFKYRTRFIKGDYVDLAKVYRRWVMDRGEFVSLEEKIEANPRLKSFLGGRAFWINFAFPAPKADFAEDFLIPRELMEQQEDGPVRVLYTYRDMKTLIERLKRLGLKRGFIKLGGWINGGYDNSHQDVWPPEPALGPVSGLKELLASEPPLIVGLHDNNQDIYAHTPSFPKGVNRSADGSLLTGGAWAGGQAYILNSRYSVEYARRNWEHIKTLEPKAMFVDIITAMQLYQSFEPGDELTKHQDLEAKIELIKFYREQGVLLGSEEAADFGVPYLDWFENRHRRTQGVSIPLWPLVFHDAVLGTRYGGVSRREGHPGWLEDMLWGYMPHFSIRPGWDDEDLFRSLDHVDRWHERIGTAEMTDHRFLADDYNVEQTTFSTGDSIICNFGDEPYTHDGKLIDSGGYLILEPAQPDNR